MRLGSSPHKTAIVSSTQCEVYNQRSWPRFDELTGTIACLFRLIKCPVFVQAPIVSEYVWERKSATFWSGSFDYDRYGLYEFLWPYCRRSRLTKERTAGERERERDVALKRCATAALSAPLIYRSGDFSHLRSYALFTGQTPKCSYALHFPLTVTLKCVRVKSKKLYFPAIPPIIANATAHITSVNKVWRQLAK